MAPSESDRVKVLVDFDSTINDFDGEVVRSLNNMFGSQYVVGDLKTWDFLREIDPEHVKATWGEDMYRSYWWTQRIPPKEGARDGIRHLIKHGFKCRIVTARDSSMKGWIEDWLRGHSFPSLNVTYNGKKDVWAERYGYGIAIEDAPHNVLDLARVGCHVYMIDMPFNTHIEEGPCITRVPSLFVAAERITGASISRTGTSGRAGNRGPLGPIPTDSQSATEPGHDIYTAQKQYGADTVLYQTDTGVRSAEQFNLQDPCY